MLPLDIQEKREKYMRHWISRDGLGLTRHGRVKKTQINMRGFGCLEGAPLGGGNRLKGY